MWISLFRTKCWQVRSILFIQLKITITFPQSALLSVQCMTSPVLRPPAHYGDSKNKTEQQNHGIYRFQWQNTKNKWIQMRRLPCQWPLFRTVLKPFFFFFKETFAIYPLLGQLKLCLCDQNRYFRSKYFFPKPKTKSKLLSQEKK